MSVIFLDIDGVLNNIAQILGDWNNQISPRADATSIDTTNFNVLRWLCSVTEAQIIISSSWRMLYSLSWFKGVFESYGWFMPPLIGVTGDSPKGHRGTEVETYVTKNNITSYIILDDDSDFFDYQPHIKTNKTTGLTIDDAVKAAKILGVVSLAQEEFNEIKQYVEVESIIPLKEGLFHVESPTGKIHNVESDEGDGKVLISCHHNNPFEQDEWGIVEWPRSEKAVNCKNCLREMKRE